MGGGGGAQSAPFLGSETQKKPRRNRVKVKSFLMTTLTLTTLFLFYNNRFNKNVEAEICPKF